MRIIGVGQPAAGDDGVGLVILEALRARSVPPGVELCVAVEASSLLSLLETPAPVLLLDAVVGLAVGEVRVLRPEDLTEGLSPLSSHGINVIDALTLARLLFAETVSQDIQIVGIGITRPEGRRYWLSVEIERAVPEAVELVLSLLKR